MHFAESFLFFEANEPPAAQACQAPRVAGGRKSILQKWIMTCQGIVCFIDKEHNKFTFFFSCSDFFFLRTKFIISNFTEDVGALRETFQVFVGFGNGTCFFLVFHLPICEAKTSAMKAGSGSTVLENSRAGRRFSRIYGLGKLGIQSCKRLRECKL